MLDFLQKIICFFHERQIPYMLSESVAMSIYILPRATRDFDFVIHLQQQDIDALVAYFQEGYYCDRDAIADAIKHKSLFNIIDYASGFKSDFVILKETEFRQTEFHRRRSVNFLGMYISVVTPEDLLLSKLIWIQELQSSIQMEDIRNLKQLNTLDWDYINTWIKKLNLNTFAIME